MDVRGAKRGGGHRSRRVAAFVAKFGGGNRDAEATIGRLVSEAREEIWGRTAAPPFLPSAALPYFRVARVEERERLLVDGGIRRDGEGFVVVVRKGLSDGRRNFTLFHELVHTWFLGPADDSKPKRGQRPMHSLEEERLCDIGAREFLLPRVFCREFLGAKAPSWGLAKELARRCAASLEASARALVECAKPASLLEEWRLREGVVMRKILASGLADEPTGRRISLHRDQSPPWIMSSLESREIAFGKHGRFVCGDYQVGAAETVVQNAGGDEIRVLSLTVWPGLEREH